MYRKASLKLKAICLPLYILPRFLKKWVAWILSALLFYVFRVRRGQTLRQCQAVFPEKNSQEIKRIVFLSYYNLMMSLLEFSYFPFSKDKIVKYTEVQGSKILDQAFKSKKPVFILTGHIGNGEIILARVGIEGFYLKLIGKRVRNSFLDALLFELRELWGLRHIPPVDSLKDLFKAIKNKEGIVFVNDQYTRPPTGVRTTFLGLETYTNSSVARLAEKFNAIVLPVNIFRSKGMSTTLEIHPEIPFERPFEDKNQNIQHMTQVYNDWLSARIKERPENYFWMHRRWKNLNWDSQL